MNEQSKYKQMDYDIQEDIFGIFRDNRYEHDEAQREAESLQMAFRKYLKPWEYDLVSQRYGFQVDGVAQEEKTMRELADIYQWSQGKVSKEIMNIQWKLKFAFERS